MSVSPRTCWAVSLIRGEGADSAARTRFSWKKANPQDAFDAMNHIDTQMGLFNVPKALGDVYLRDLIPPSGLIQFPEGMPDMFDDPAGIPAPPPGARLEVARYPGCINWRILVRALLIKTEGEAAPLISTGRPSRRLRTPRCARTRSLHRGVLKRAYTFVQRA